MKGRGYRAFHRGDNWGLSTAVTDSVSLGMDPYSAEGPLLHRWGSPGSPLGLLMVIVKGLKKKVQS